MVVVELLVMSKVREKKINSNAVMVTIVMVVVLVR